MLSIAIPQWTTWAIYALVARLVESYQIDPRRVYATGMSNGGDMSYLLACKAADVFRAIAPVAGTMMQATADNVHQARQCRYWP